MPFGNVFEKINSEYYQLTSAEKKVADYAVIHQQKTQFMSISELAEEAGVAEATISRFCKRLGYKGYSAFKLAVANSTARRVEAPTVPGEIRPEDSIEELCQKLYAADRDAMAQTVELIRPDSVRKAADLLFSAEKVLCMGQGGSMILAQECAHLFSTARPNFYAGRGTVFFLLWLHGGTAEKPENHPGPESGGHPGHPVPQIPRCGLCRRSASVRLSGGAPPGRLGGGPCSAALPDGRAVP